MSLKKNEIPNIEIDIEIINTIENIDKVYTKRWRTIYKVIQKYV